jgi:Family of unknown function (DUF6065)
MDQTAARFAWRCLPIIIANQAGWVLKSCETFLAVWDGGPEKESVTLDWIESDGPHLVASHFGHGILTWTIPYLFRTPLGIDLLVRGLPNCPKDGVSPLEGIVETSWSVSTFTMNWQLTYPDLPVRFDKGEPLCMIVPIERSLLESVKPQVNDLSDNPELAEKYEHWASSRGNFLEELAISGSGSAAAGWQKDYMRGLLPDGSSVDEHFTRWRLQPFIEKPNQDPGNGNDLLS